MDRVIFHCDLNAFYASVELLSYPELREKPVAVCGDPAARHGIILAKNEAAKRFGIKQDDIIDMLFFAVPLAIVGARLYYIVFYLDLFRNAGGSLDLGKMLDIRDGGLAIYGGVIAAIAQGRHIERKTALFTLRRNPRTHAAVCGNAARQYDFTVSRRLLRKRQTVT